MPPPDEKRRRCQAPLEKVPGTSTSTGLCGRCVHRELLASARSSFLRCALSRSDTRFPRYPPLPVLACVGFVEGAE
jgi:hypothetical protein